MQQSEIDKYEKIKENFGNSYGSFNHAKFHYKYLTQFLSNYKNRNENITIADLGCGTGEFCIWLKQNYSNFTVIGIDPVFTPEESNSGVEFIKGNSTNIPVHSVDILTSFDVMEHIHPKDLEKSLEEIARVTDTYITKIATQKEAIRILPDEDLHVSVHPIEWWTEAFRLYFPKVKIENGLLICEK